VVTVKDLRGLQNAVRHTADPLVRLRQVADEALVLVPRADGVSVDLIGEDGYLTNVCAAGMMTPHIGARVRIQGTLPGLAIETGTVQWSADTLNDLRVDRDTSQRLGIGSMVCLPLMRGGVAVGLLAATGSVPGLLTEDDVCLLTTVADFVSVVVGAVVELGPVTSALMSSNDWQPVARDEQAAKVRSRVSAFVANVLTPNLAEDVAAYERVRDLIDHADVAVVFQPVIDLATGELAGHEALTRFPDGRPPNLWFDEAHRAGLGTELELFALSTVLASTPEHLEGFLAVNVSRSWWPPRGSTSAWPGVRAAATSSSS
jgi:GAF domain/EAL domain